MNDTSLSKTEFFDNGIRIPLTERWVDRGYLVSCIKKIQWNDGDEKVNVTLPATDGRLSVKSDCGKWTGELQLETIGVTRWLNWIAMTRPVDSTPQP